MLNFFKGLFRQPKVQYEKPVGITREAKTMLSILELQENERVNKKHFIQAGIYNPGRAKSSLVKRHDKLILCKREGNQSYWMYITNPLVARNNMTEKEREQYSVDHLYTEYVR